MEEEVGKISEVVGAQTDGSFLRQERREWELLPGLPNDITLHHIASKLPWSGFTVLLSVSRPWQDAIESRQVFNARVRSQSAETFVVIHFRQSRLIALYSVRDKSCYRLPRSPHFESVNPRSCGITSVDSKLYVFGGLEESGDYSVSKNVYLFDPIGQRKWIKCADMLEPRHPVGCGVVDEKIYVFGGGGYPCNSPEVYDPKVNAWSRIAGLPSTDCPYEVLTMGEEIFLHHRELTGSPYLLAYHTTKDEWRAVQPFRRLDSAKIFIAQGKVHLITQIGIDVLDDKKSTWQHLHSCSTQSLADGADGAYVEDVISVNEELFSAAIRYNWMDYEQCYVLFKSNGFHSDREELLWQQEAVFQEEFRFVCTIQF